MKDKQTLFDVTIAILEKMKAVLETEKPDVVLVHGDTSTTFSTASGATVVPVPEPVSWPPTSFMASATARSVSSTPAKGPSPAMMEGRQSRQ